MNQEHMGFLRMSDAFFGAFVSFLLGSFFLYGTFQRWKILDPPKDWRWWGFSSHSLLKEIFGQSIVIKLNYTTGAALIIVSVIFLIQGIAMLCSSLGWCR